MSGVKAKQKSSSKTAKSSESFELLWQQALSDYVTEILWLPDGTLIAASAAGELVCHQDNGKSELILQAATDQSLDALALSSDGKLLAASGQSGQVSIWRLPEPTPIAKLENAPAWVDRLAWSPVRNQLAFSLGKYVQVWDAETAEIITTLNFESSVLDLTWHPSGNQLTVAGYQSIKVWSALGWDEDPEVIEIASASTIICWSPDGSYIASGNIDKTISVIDWQRPTEPWLMRGFPGKIRQMVWTDAPVKQAAPLLASASADSIVVWHRHPDNAVGWEGQVLGQHDARIQAMQFQPGSSMLASAGEDGWVVLWPKAARLGQMLKGASQGFSSLCWHPKGDLLAAGGRNGELIVWAKTVRGKGFGQK